MVNTEKHEAKYMLIEKTGNNASF